MLTKGQWSHLMDCSKVPFLIDIDALDAMWESDSDLAGRGYASNAFWFSHWDEESDEGVIFANESGEEIWLPSIIWDGDEEVLEAISIAPPWDAAFSTQQVYDVMLGIFETDESASNAIRARAIQDAPLADIWDVPVQEDGTIAFEDMASALALLLVSSAVSDANAIAREDGETEQRKEASEDVMVRAYDLARTISALNDPVLYDFDKVMGALAS